MPGFRYDGTMPRIQLHPTQRQLLAATSRSLFCILFVLVGGDFSSAETGIAPLETDGTARAVVEGTVTYRIDPKRPWRYSRYYVNNPAGELAEAVIAMRGEELTNFPRSAPARTVSIDQELFQFVPETIAILAGDSVRFTNSDSTIHNVRSSSTIARFDISIGHGEKYRHTFKRPGGLRLPVELGCAFHGGMRGWIFVFDHPCFAVTGRDGKFCLEDVPPGRYELRLRHPAGQLKWKQTVDVKPGQTLRTAITVSPDDWTNQHPSRVRSRKNRSDS